MDRVVQTLIAAAALTIGISLVMLNAQLMRSGPAPAKPAATPAQPITNAPIAKLLNMEPSDTDASNPNSIPLAKAYETRLKQLATDAQCAVLRYASSPDRNSVTMMLESPKASGPGNFVKLAEDSLMVESTEIVEPLIARTQDGQTTYRAVYRLHLR